jgi:hypothetical protein
MANPGDFAYTVKQQADIVRTLLVIGSRSLRFRTGEVQSASY